MDHFHYMAKPKYGWKEHTLSQLTSAHSTHEGGNFPSQPQQNPRSIHEVEVKDRNSPNMHKEKSMMTIEDDEQTDQATPSPKKHEEGIACDDEPKVEASKELEKGLEKLEDEDPKEVRMIETPIEKHLDESIHDAIIIYYDHIHHDDAPFIEKSVAHTITRSEKILPLVTDDDSTLE